MRSPRIETFAESISSLLLHKFLPNSFERKMRKFRSTERMERAEWAERAEKRLKDFAMLFLWEISSFLERFRRGSPRNFDCEIETRKLLKREGK